MRGLRKALIALLCVAACVVAAQAEAAKPKLRAMMLYMEDDYNTYPVAKELEAATGYKVNYEMLPEDNIGDKLNLIVGSGEPYDIVMIPYSLKAQFGEYARRGALVDLGPLIDKYGPNIKKAISGESFEFAKANGKIYGIPTQTISYAWNTIVIRQDWLDAVGLKAPETIDDFVAVLKAFKDKDPGKNGSQNVPFVFDANAYAMMSPNLAGAFGITNEWNDVGGRMVNRAVDPRMKEYVAFVAKLYREGLLDPDFAVNKSATVMEKFTSGKAGAMSCAWWDAPSILSALAKTQPSAKIAYLKPLKGKGGRAGLNYTYGFENLTVIPKSSKNAIETIKYLNAKLDDNTFRLVCIGQEGKHYTVKDGAYYPILPTFTQERNQAFNYFNGVVESKYQTYWQARVRKDSRLYDAWAFMNGAPKSQLIVDYATAAPYMPQSSKSINALSTLVSDSLIAIAIDKGDTDRLVDELAAKWKAAGGSAYDKEMNDWYVPFKKTLTKK
jgi:putative aldouronate transport system substrate-binding protein